MVISLFQYSHSGITDFEVRLEVEMISMSSMREGHLGPGSVAFIAWAAM